MRISFLIVCMLLTVVAFTQSPTYSLDSNRQLHELKAYTYILVDSLDKLTNDEIVSGKQDYRFQPYSAITTSDKINRTYWLRFSLKTTSVNKNWWLILRDGMPYTGYSSQNEHAELFYKASGKMIHDKTGTLVPRSEKSLQKQAGFNGFTFSPGGEETQTVYIKIPKQSINYIAYSYPVLHDPALPVPVPGLSTMLRILNAIAIVFSILSFFFFFFIKEKSYLFFALYTLLLSQHYLILHPDLPFIDAYIPENPQLIPGFWLLLTQGSFLLFFLFGRYFINLPALSKQTDKWFRIFIATWTAIILIDAAWLFAFQKTFFPEFTMYPFVAATVGFFVRFAFFKNILAKLFVGGALWLLCFTILGILSNEGVISLFFNPWPIGQVGQFIIYAAALAYKVRLNEKARAEAARIKDMDNIKSKFFANISHEFRTPLTLIQGPLQQIEEAAKTKDESITVPLRHIKTMRRNTDRLLELVNQLLDLSKLDSGKMNLQVIKGDVLQLLKALTASFESMAERKGIHYSVHFTEATNIGFFDKDKLEKIVSNLLTNAFKYTPEQGSVSVEITIEEKRLRFSVEDNGPGIPKKELDKIFDRFYQMEGTEDKGSGIGLALVKELVDLYRGQISVNSEPGKGSRFKVSLPIEKDAFKEAELVYGEWKGEQSFINTSVNEKEAVTIREEMKSHLPLLLITEDNNDLRNFIKETVQQHYQVIEAVNGKEGLEKATKEIPDVIVSDVMMPLMDGFAMTEKLKRDERTSHIPVIILTAKAGQQHKLEGLGTGADDYLTKPFDAKELLVRIQNLINGRKLLRKKFAVEILLKPSEISANSMDDIFLNKVMQAIEKNMSEEEFGVEELAKEVAMSRSQLHRKLVALTGQSPSEVLRNTRLLRAKELLQKKAATPSEVAYKVGFNSHTYFSKCFKEEFGVSPSDVKNL
jgi:signal transduction histidine kinase/DNA-binding response OmpR family regulator